MSAFRTVALSIGALLSGPVMAQNNIGFVSNNYFTFGDPGGRTAGIALADFDGDGDFDAFTANGRHWAQQDYIYLNNGNGRMLTAVRIGEILATAYKPAVGDFDSDGDPDIVSLRDRIESQLFINKGKLRFENAGALGVSGPARSAAVADFDRNGQPDLLIAQRSGRNYIVYDFTRRNSHLVYIDQETQSVRGAVADFNGDRYPDAAFANIGDEGSYVVMNDGAGALNEVIWLGAETSGAVDIAAADLDNDGDQDIIVGSWDPARASSIVINEGGVFSDATPFSLTEDKTFSLEAGDLNGDGVIDIAVGNIDQPNAVYIGKGDLAYERMVLPEDETALTYDVAIGDLNGDGRPDLVFANSDSRNRIHINVAPGDEDSVLRR